VARGHALASAHCCSSGSCAVCVRSTCNGVTET
jgi:hypothetical protein